MDVLSNVHFVHCTPANISDDEGLLAMIKQNQKYFLRLPPEHSLTILLDNGYHKEYLEQQLEQANPLLRERITIELAAKPTPAQKTASKQSNPAKQGFVQARLCRDQTTLGRGKSQCVDQPVPSVVEKLRRTAANQ